MAAGPAKRWQADSRLKQLVEIDGEPLLLRTIGQIEAHGYDCIVVTHEPRIQEAVGLERCFNPDERDMHAASVLSTTELWGRRTILFEGDAILSEQMMERVLSEHRVFAAFGDSGEHYAYMWSWVIWPIWVPALRKAIRNVREYRRGFGQLLDAYAIMYGHEDRETLWTSDDLIIIEDYSTDFDSVESYDEFLRANPWARGET